MRECYTLGLCAVYNVWRCSNPQRRPLQMNVTRTCASVGFSTYGPGFPQREHAAITRIHVVVCALVVTYCAPIVASAFALAP